MLLHHASQFAIRAALFLAQQPPGKLTPVHEIAEQVGISETYLAKITQRLVSAGLLRSFRGAGKGLELGRAPEEITLSSVVSAIQGSLCSNGCILGVGTCSEEHPCALHSEWLSLRNQICTLLDKATLADLIRSIQPGENGIISVDFVGHAEKRRQP
jgi:Rrf2 family transcriptional regulator, iron-sulfur cluster assembly transcription factor